MQKMGQTPEDKGFSPVVSIKIADFIRHLAKHML